MSIDDLMAACDDAGIRVQVVAGNLRVTNARALTNELRAGLKQHKDQIIHELSMPFFDRVLMLFGGQEIDEKGQIVKQKQLANGGLL